MMRPFHLLRASLSSWSTTAPQQYGNKHTPTELRLRVQERQLEICFPLSDPVKGVASHGGVECDERSVRFSLPAELLRVYSPSAGNGQMVFCRVLMFDVDVDC
jgi:DUF971 family protein